MPASLPLPQIPRYLGKAPALGFLAPPFPNSKFTATSRLLSWPPAKGSLKLRCAPGRDGLSSAGLVADDLERLKFRDDSSGDMDEMEHMKKQLEELFNEVKAMLKMGNKDDALDLLQANYEVVEDQLSSGLKGIEQASVLDVLALGYMGAGDVKIVAHILNQLKEIVGILHDDLPLMDSILTHMGSVYVSLAKYEDALLVYGRALKILERDFGNHSPFLVTSLLGMAKAFNLTGRESTAISIYHRSITILEMVRGAQSEELVPPLFALGNLFISEGKVTDAESCFSRILQIYTESYGENDGRVGMAMCSLAQTKCATGSLDEAIFMYKKGLQLIKHTNYLGLDDDILEKLRMDLAELLHLAGREREGRQLLEECLLINERYKGSGHPSSAIHLLNLATSYSRSKNFVEAERLLRMSLHILSKTVGPEDHSITIPMLHLAVVLYHLKQDEEAEMLALRVLSIREAAFGKESLPVGEALDCLVSIQMRIGKGDTEMLSKLRRILSIQEKELGFESEKTISTLKKVVFYLDKMGKKEELLPLRRRLALLKAKIGPRAPS